MRTGRERLEETLWDLIMDAGNYTPAEKIVAQYADRILDDIDRGIITASEEV